MKKSLLILAVALAAIFAYIAPQETAAVLSVAAILAGTVFVVANTSRQSRRSSLIPAVNTLAPNWGTSSNGKTMLSSAAVATRYLLGKFGADYRHVAAVAAASDEPIGVITDEAAAAEEEMFVELLGLTNRTVPMVAGVAITLGADLYALASGKVGLKPTAAGTYWRVGKALQPADADGDVIEVQPCKPRKLIVIAALTSTNGVAAAAAADLAGLAAEAEKIGDDARAIAGALNGDADVALATT